MKRIFTVLLALCVFYLSSCTTSSTNNTVVLPKADSVMNGGNLQISFNGESFFINNLVVLNSPVITSTASMIATDINDTLWIGQFQITDHKSKTVSLNLTGYQEAIGGGTALGTYTVTTNNSTLTDYSQGENRVYAVSIGSTITVTAIGDTTVGTLLLNLFYNNNNYPATGSFKIPN